MTTDIVEQVKERNQIEDVIRGDGYDVPQRQTRYLKVPHQNGLVIDRQSQTFHWNGTGEYGDVVAWVQRQRRLDFKQAVEWLAQRSNMPAPTWGADHGQRLAARLQADALTTAARVFHRWFYGSPAAQEYASRRGWTLAREDADSEDSTAGTAERAMLGYSGEGTQAERLEMRNELTAAGVDLQSPVAVAVLGMHGNVLEWVHQHDVNGYNEDWLIKGYIPGMLGYKRLVYPHLVAGRAVYLSGRSIEDKVHYNLPECLVGKRAVYYNHVYLAGADQAVIVEGQADALSLAQWGIAAVALCGVKLDDELVQVLRERHRALYLALDADVTGIVRAWDAADQVGPMVRLWCARDMDGLVFPTEPKMPERQRTTIERANEIAQAMRRVYEYPLGADAVFDEHPVKDANDLLQVMTANRISPEDQRRGVLAIMKAAPTFAELSATWAGMRQGAERDEAVKGALSVISRMGELELSQYRARLSKALGVGVRELTQMLKTYDAQASKAAATGEPRFTWGGYIDGYLIEYLYDLETDTALLAWRTPEGVVESGTHVDIDGVRYEPSPSNDVLRNSAVIFPSRLGEKKPLAELVGYVELYLKSVYLLPPGQVARLMAYYVMLTWLYDAFETIIYLRAMGSAGSGKSELMRRIGLICYRTMTANGAGSTSSLFRSLERYRGTVFIDEADIANSDTESDMVKFYNLGAMRNNPIWRTVEVTNASGQKDWEAVSFQTFCPKLVAMRKEFRDDAVGSRSLTFKLQPREVTELVAAGVPLSITAEMRAKANALRNLLLRWRLETWQPEIEINPAFYEPTISARLNQVAGPLLAIAADDPGQQEEIRKNLRDYYLETVLSKSMTLAARVIEALWKIWQFPDLHKNYVKVEPSGEALIKVGDICRIAGELMDEMNETGGDEEEEGGKRQQDSKLKPQRVGRILREDLQLQMTERRRDGFYVYWNEPRLMGLSTRYGIDRAEFGPQNGETTSSLAGKPDQNTLL